MVDNDGYTLAEELADDAHLVARGEGEGGKGVVGNVFELEVTRVVHEADVDAALVGGVVVYDLEVPVAYLGLTGNVFHNGAVLDLADTYNGRTDGSGLGLELRNGVGEVVDLRPVFTAVPLSLTFGGKFFVAAEGVVGYGVEKVLEVIECYTGHLHTAVTVALSQHNARSQYARYEHENGDSKGLFHNIAPRRASGSVMWIQRYNNFRRSGY